MNKLFASYGNEEEFKSVAEKIIQEESDKNNKILAKSLRKSLMGLEYKRSSQPIGSFTLLPNKANEYIELIEPSADNGKSVVLTAHNEATLLYLEKEFRNNDKIKKHGLPLSNKVLLCGPPGSGKTVTAQMFARKLGLPLYSLKLDAIISSFLGETATNIRKVFEFAQHTPCVLFLDEFDSLARSREDNSEHSELRRVVNSLLIFIERLQPKGFLFAATNLDNILDNAIWRRFDEVLWFGLPNAKQAESFVNNKFKNVNKNFSARNYMQSLKGYSYSELERVCEQAIKRSLVDGRSVIEEADLTKAIADAKSRKLGLMKAGLKK